MNSDDFYDDLDSAALEQIDALESAALLKRNIVSDTGHRVSGDRGSKGKPLSIGEDSFDLSFNFDESELQALDPVEKRPQAGPSRLGRTIQTTLDGGFVTPSQKPPNSRSQIQGVKSPSDKQFGLMAPKTKKWDHTAFAKTGIRIAKRAQAKGKVIDTDGWGGEQPEYEFVDQSPGKSSGQLPAPFMPSECFRS
jgi:ATP-dependent DNA helicase MPH1